MIRVLGVAVAVVALVLGSAGVAAAAPASFVGIPARYDYDPDKGALDDYYCTKSANDFPGNRPVGWPRELVADFRGPCAVHDLCYEENPKTEKGRCDDGFLADLMTNCRFQYEYKTHHYDLMRQCETSAHLKHEAVKEFGGG